MSITSMKHMVNFEFEVETWRFTDEQLPWNGVVMSITYHGSQVEFQVESLSNFTATAGRYSPGTFLCVPRFGIALALGAPGNVIHGVDKVFETKSAVFIAAITAVYALATSYQQGLYEASGR